MVASFSLQVSLLRSFPQCGTKFNGIGIGHWNLAERLHYYYFFLMVNCWRALLSISPLRARTHVQWLLSRRFGLWDEGLYQNRRFRRSSTPNGFQWEAIVWFARPRPTLLVIFWYDPCGDNDTSCNFHFFLVDVRKSWIFDAIAEYLKMNFFCYLL